MVNTTLPVKYLPLKTTFMRFHHIVFVVTIIFFLSCKKEASRDQPYKDVLTSGPWQISSLDVSHLLYCSPPMKTKGIDFQKTNSRVLLF